MDQDGGDAVVRGPADVERVPMLSTRARRLANDAFSADASAGALLRTMLDEGLDLDALRIAPFVLSIRHSVWWGCLWAWHATGASAPDSDDAALAASVRWVQQPTPEHVAAADASWPTAGLNSPAGCCARAAALAGHLSPGAAPSAPALTIGAAKTLAGGAMVAIETASQKQIAASPTQFVAFAIDVANSQVPWIRA